MRGWNIELKWDFWFSCGFNFWVFLSCLHFINDGWLASHFKMDLKRFHNTNDYFKPNLQKEAGEPQVSFQNIQHKFYVQILLMYLFVFVAGLVKIKEAHDTEEKLNEVERLLKNAINMPCKVSSLTKKTSNTRQMRNLINDMQITHLQVLHVVSD